MSKTAYHRTALTGGTTASLDGINGSVLLDGDIAFVQIAPTTDLTYFYVLDADSGAAESSPDVIAPDLNAGDKRWLLQKLFCKGVIDDVLTNGYLPYHVSDSSGLADSVIRTDGSYIGIGASPASIALFYVTGALPGGGGKGLVTFKSSSPGGALGSHYQSMLTLLGTAYIDDYSQIQFGETDTGDYAPAVIAYKSTDSTNYGKGSIIIATRNVTTDSAPTIRMTIGADGNVTIGSGTGTAGKLDVRDGNFVLSDADVAHGITAQAETQVFGKFSPKDAASGGLFIQGFSDDAWTSGLYIQAYMGSDDPTDTVPAISIVASKKNGTSYQALSATETLLKFQNSGADIFSILGSGSFILGASTAVGSSGAKVLMLDNGVAPSTSPANAIQTWAADYAAGDSRLYIMSEKSTNKVIIGDGDILCQGTAILTDLTDGYVPYHSSDTAGLVNSPIYTNGTNVGIGTTSLAARLDVLDNTAGVTQIRLRSSSTPGLEFYQTSGLVTNWVIAAQKETNNAIEIFPSTSVGGTTYTTPVVTILNTGNVGIGTTGPTHKLDVYSATGNVFTWMESGDNSRAQFIAANSVNHAYFGVESTAGTTFTNTLADAALFGSNGAYASQIITNGAVAMTILSGGNVGIGTTGPGEKLVVVRNAVAGLINTAPVVRIKNGQGTGNFITQHFSGAVSDGMIGFMDSATAATRRMSFAASASSVEDLTISGTGNVGIGTTSFGTSAAKVLAMYNGTAPTTSPADTIQAWAGDLGGVAGKTTYHMRDEANNIAILGHSNITAGTGTGITVAYNGHINRQVYKVTTTYAAYSDTDTVKGVVIATLPAKMKIVGFYADTTTPYTGGSVSAATLKVGITAEDTAEIIAEHDVLSGAVTKGLLDADMGTSMTRAAQIQGGYLPSWSSTTAIYATINTTDGNTNALTAGSTTFYIITEMYN